jgi:long-chain acyl-CoA synthetase
LLPNVPHFPLTYYGTLKLGAMLSAAPPTSVEREVEYFIRDSGARTIVTLDLLYEKVADVWERCGVERVIVGNVTDFMPPWVRIAGPILGKVPKPKQPVPYGDKVQSMRRFLSRGRRAKAESCAGPDDIALLQYTGGTTGTPKAAMLTHRNVLTNARQMRDWFPTLQEGKETILAALPFFHIYGVTLALNAGLLLAARNVLIANPRVMGDIFGAIQRHRPTVFPGVPTLYVALLNDERSRRYDLHSIDVCVCGGAPLPIEVKREFEALTGGHLLEGYGLSEASPCTHAQPYDESGKHGSIGLPIAGTEARVVDETGEPVPLGEAGELIIRGPQVMSGYWRRPEETAEVLRDGWLRTGDVARMDEDGYFYIVDRKKDLIITGGENIYPREIEEVLFEHPKVREAAVAGVPHAYGGEIAKAFIVLKEGETATQNEIKQFLGDRLAKHKVPRSVEFRSELPKAATGKVLRRELVEEEKRKQAARPRDRMNNGRPNQSGTPGPAG